MKVTQEAADTILVHQVLLTDVPNALVVAEDTDVFVLFCHFIHAGYITGQVKMIQPDIRRDLASILIKLLKKIGASCHTFRHLMDSPAVTMLQNI